MNMIKNDLKTLQKLQCYLNIYIHILGLPTLCQLKVSWPKSIGYLIYANLASNIQDVY